jgi:type IX secretion system PorP/SprF family membrane protein
MTLKHLFTAVAIAITSVNSNAQGLHFSQYYNAPLLVNPANAALMPDNDFRVGVNYRDQWSSVPVPYKTFSFFGDFQLLRNKNLTNWLGVGFAIWNDKAGDGKLSLTKFEGVLAYHVQLGEISMISAGASFASAQRKIDFNKLTFNEQWDGFEFNRQLPNNEQGYTQSTNYTDVSAGVNFSYFPSENMFLKIGAGVAHLNQPKETFYGGENKLGIRPSANIDLLLKLNPSVIVNPSLYYSNQKSASEFLIGSLFQINLTGSQQVSTQLILGSFYRVNEAVVGAIGVQYDKWRFVSSYDFTTSSLTPVNQGRGAGEISVIYEGVYNQFAGSRRTLNCPRF